MAEGPTMRTAAIVLVCFVATALPCRSALAEDDSKTRPAQPPGWSTPERRGFDVEVLISGRPLGHEYRDGHRLVRAAEGAEYELRVTNPLPDRVAVAISVDGL